MSDTYIEPILWTRDDYEDLFLKYFNKYASEQGISQHNSATMSADFYDNTHEGDNLTVHIGYFNSMRSLSALRTTFFTASLAKWGVKLTPNTGRVCLVRIPVESYVSGDTDKTYIYQYAFIGNSQANILCDYSGLTNITFNKQDVNYDITSGEQTTVSAVTTGTSTITDTSFTPVNNTTVINAFLSQHPTTDENKLIISELFVHGQTVGNYGALSPLTNSRYIYGLYNSYSTSYQTPCLALDSVPSWIPIFNIEDGAEPIIKFLDNGDDSGRKDPFDPSNKKIETITDKLSDYRVYAYRDDSNKARTKFSVIAYNTENIAKYDRLADEWGLIVLDTIHDFDFALVGSKTNTKYPQITFTHEMLTDYYALGLSFENLSEDVDFTPIKVVFSRSDTSESHVKSTGVNYDGSTTRSNITDGYKYVASNGHWVEVLYRAPDIKDFNDGYPDPDDTDNDQSGNDSDYAGASGLRTFAINNTDFNAINGKLWSTDWSTVFKSNSIDPIRCVIACKGIPFTADNVSSAEVMIANLDTGLTKNYVKSVKSFTSNSVLMPSFTGDFTDITLTHIRCYLPYIGWIELPASECISRVAYSSVGIEAKPKRLKFKYIVDFVDGNVRCVVSVNNTERWFFDGNCAIDIPVTSDNHTQAISNAIRSGVQTGLSIVTAIGGAVAKSAGAVAGGVMGAMQSAPNIYPTYSFTATSNGSGYINASMNQHIMLVIEHPNVIRSADYAKRVGVPCGLSLNLGSLHGYTRCVDVNVTGIDATPNEVQRIKSLLESGVYL